MPTTGLTTQQEFAQALQWGLQTNDPVFVFGMWVWSVAVMSQDDAQTVLLVRAGEIGAITGFKVTVERLGGGTEDGTD